MRVWTILLVLMVADSAVAEKDLFSNAWILLKEDASGDVLLAMLEEADARQRGDYRYLLYSAIAHYKRRDASVGDAFAAAARSAMSKDGKTSEEIAKQFELLTFYRKQIPADVAETSAKACGKVIHRISSIGRRVDGGTVQEELEKELRAVIEKATKNTGAKPMLFILREEEPAEIAHDSE